MMNNACRRMLINQTRNAHLLIVFQMSGEAGATGLRELRMKPRDNAISMKRKQIEDKRRQVGQIETMIEDFNRMIADLDLEVEAEHRRTGIDDDKHYAYSTFARAAIQRRQNLQTSVDDLQHRLTTAEAALDLAEAELARDEERVDRDNADADRRIGGRRSAD
jgi:chromosome segregation ATPase